MRRSRRRLKAAARRGGAAAAQGGGDDDEEQRLSTMSTLRTEQDLEQQEYYDPNLADEEREKGPFVVVADHLQRSKR